MSICHERKLTLSGETKTYRCELISLEQGVGILRYVIEQEYDVAGFRLSPGDETLAIYWEDRPYTLYVWFRKRQGDRAHYFNIADSVLLRPEEFIWRDLSVDLLVDPAGTIRVLDEHELPQDLDGDVLAYIRQAQRHLLAHFRTIIEEADLLMRRQGAAPFAGNPPHPPSP